MKKYIPNALTCCNLISGCIATLYAFTGQHKLALGFIVLGAVFDFFDGMVARLLHVSSPIGKELDSLADVITFGVAPSTIICSFLYVAAYPEFLAPYHSYISLMAFLMAAFSALRLAKFNIDTRQTTTFIGLPTPANALFWASLLVGASHYFESSSISFVFVLGLMFVSCWLLVAEIPMFSLKFKHWGWKGNEVKYCFAGISLVLLLLLGITGFAFVVMLYVLVSVLVDKFAGK